VISEIQIIDYELWMMDFQSAFWQIGFWIMDVELWIIDVELWICPALLDEGIYAI